MKYLFANFTAIGLRAILFTLLLVGLIACAASVGPDIEVSEIELPEETATASLAGVEVSVGIFDDSRAPTLGELTEAKSVTQADGEVGLSVEKAMLKALSSKGASVSQGSGVRLSGEVREWKSEFSAASTGSITSSAALFVEASDSTGRTVFSGVYQGVRKSSFPIIAKQDIQDSLSLAMGEAITQVVNDPKLIDVLRN